MLIYSVITMKLYIKRDDSAVDAAFVVFNSSGIEKYFAVVAKSHSAKKLFVKNTNGIIVSKIRRISLPNLYAYTVNANGKTVRLLFNTVNGELVCRCYGLNWRICGNLQTKSFSILDVDNTIIATHKKAFSACGGYELNVTNDSNELLSITISICINMFNTVDNLVAQAV